MTIVLIIIFPTTSSSPASALGSRPELGRFGSQDQMLFEDLVIAIVLVNADGCDGDCTKDDDNNQRLVTKTLQFRSRRTFARACPETVVQIPLCESGLLIKLIGVVAMKMRMEYDEG